MRNCTKTIIFNHVCYDSHNISLPSFLVRFVVQQGFVDGIGPMSSLPTPLAKLGVSVLSKLNFFFFCEIIKLHEND